MAVPRTCLSFLLDSMPLCACRFFPSELKRRREHVCFVEHSPLGFKAGQSGRDGASAAKRSHSATADLDLSGAQSVFFFFALEAVWVAPLGFILASRFYQVKSCHKMTSPHFRGIRVRNTPAEFLYLYRPAFIHRKHSPRSELKVEQRATTKVNTHGTPVHLPLYIPTANQRNHADPVGLHRKSFIQNA